MSVLDKEFAKRKKYYQKKKIKANPVYKPKPQPLILGKNLTEVLGLKKGN